MTLAHGFTSERPIGALLGALLCLGGATALAWTSVMAIYRWDGYVIVVPAVLLGVIGGALLWTVLRRGRHLRVGTLRGVRKLIFDGARDRSAANEVLQVASARWGYVVELSSSDDGWPTPR